MANTTTSYVLFKPRNGIIDDSFNSDVEKYKEQFKIESVCYTLYKHDTYAYSCGMRYNHHDFETYYNSCAGLSNLEVNISIYTEDHDCQGWHYVFTIDGIEEVLTSEQELTKTSEESKLEDLQENWE